MYLEVGADAPDTAQPADAFPVALHVTLNGIQSATNLDCPDRMAVMVRITEILIHSGVKVWFLDRFYVGLS